MDENGGLSPLGGNAAMKEAAPKPFFFEGGDRAILLLHGFTGTTADVRMLGRYLQKKGYTSYAPQYKGHGVPPEQLVESGPEDWWQDVIDGYNFLQEQGYEYIAVAGLSLGGVFSLKLGYTLRIKGIIPMCAPMHIKSEEVMYRGVLSYAKEYKHREGKSKELIEREMEEFKPMPTLLKLKQLLQEVRDNVDMIYTPTFVVQARHDEMINTESANIIYDNVECDHKKLKWYEQSTHVITLGQEKEQLHEDVYKFLESLDWDRSL